MKLDGCKANRPDVVLETNFVAEDAEAMQRRRRIRRHVRGVAAAAQRNARQRAAARTRNVRGVVQGEVYVSFHAGERSKCRTSRAKAFARSRAAQHGSAGTVLASHKLGERTLRRADEVRTWSLST